MALIVKKKDTFLSSFLIDPNHCIQEIPSTHSQSKMQDICHAAQSHNRYRPNVATKKCFSFSEPEKITEGVR